MIKHQFDPDCQFVDRMLGMVITIQEACIFWGKSRRTVDWAILRDEVTARKSVTGGTWLLTYYSCMEKWGEPIVPISDWMQD
jgi:hypothetical protein